MSPLGLVSLLTNPGLSPYKKETTMAYGQSPGPPTDTASGDDNYSDGPSDTSDSSTSADDSQEESSEDEDTGDQENPTAPSQVPPDAEMAGMMQ